jgi:hypothetical protein
MSAGEPLTERPHGGQALLPRLLELARSAATGTLLIRSATRVLTILVRRGRIQHADGGDPNAVLSVLTTAGVVNRKMLKKGEKRTRGDGGAILPLLLAEGDVDPGPAAAALQAWVTTMLSNAIACPASELEWLDHEPDLAAVNPEARALVIDATLENVLREAARAGGAKDFAASLLPESDEILAASPAARHWFEGDAEAQAVERMLLALTDGDRDVDEVLGGIDFPRDQALELLARMKAEGELMEIAPSDLLSLAAVSRKRGRLDKCLRVYLRAERVEPALVDLDLTIAKVYENMSDDAGAAGRYLSHAEKCLRAGKAPDARESFRRAIALVPGDLETRQRLLGLYDPKAELEDLEREARALAIEARSADDLGLVMHALELLVNAGRALAEETAQLTSLWFQSLGSETAGARIDELALRREAAGDLAGALALIRSSIDAQGSSPALRERVASLAARVGGPVGIAALEELAREAPESERTARFEQLLSCAPEHEMALEALARVSFLRGDRAEARELLSRLTAVLRARGDLTRLERTLRLLLRLDPEDAESRRLLAEGYLRSGRSGLAVGQLVRAAEQDLNRGRPDGALEALSAVLAHDPIHAEARRIRLRTLEVLGRGAQAAREREDLAHVLLLCDKAGEAAELLETWGAADDVPVDRLRLLAQAQEESGAGEAAGRTRIRAARAALKSGDFGCARALIAEVQAADAEDLVACAAADALAAAEDEHARARLGGTLQAGSEERSGLEAERDRLRAENETLRAEAQAARAELEASREKAPAPEAAAQAREEARAEYEQKLREKEREFAFRLANREKELQEFFRHDFDRRAPEQARRITAETREALQAEPATLVAAAAETAVELEPERLPAPAPVEPAAEAGAEPAAPSILDIARKLMNLKGGV